MKRVVHLLNHYVGKNIRPNWHILEVQSLEDMDTWCEATIDYSSYVSLTFDPNKVTCRACKEASALYLLAGLNEEDDGACNGI